MDLNVSKTIIENNIKKKYFKLKPVQKNGFLLSIRDCSNNKIRFFHACFNSTGKIIAGATNEGYIIIVDMIEEKYWVLPATYLECTILKFSDLNENNLLIGCCDGEIDIIDVQFGELIGKLSGHSEAVVRISYSSNSKYCISSNKNEGIIWNLETNTKLQVLNLQKDVLLKFVLFMPVTNNILACFQDNIINIWQFSTLDIVKQIVPPGYNIRNVIFTKNGSGMIIIYYQPILAFYSINTWKLDRVIQLPEHILSVKYAEFVPQSFEVDCNKILAILGGDGKIVFYDFEKNCIISELVSSKSEINRFHSSINGKLVALLLCTGEIDVFDITQYILPTEIVTVEKTPKVSKKRKFDRCKSKLTVIKKEINLLLEIDKLKMILREVGEYPNVHRLIIWEKLLQLPNNRDYYNGIINHVTMECFLDLKLCYPLRNKNIISNLKNLLNNLVSWCPFFANVTYLPVFAFPFVKIFQNKPISCFEAIVTIILNWCQHWFEYFPLPPVNVLAMVENIILEHDPKLLHHFTVKKVPASSFIWPLLETAFSEVLSGPNWLILWDHVLSNEPAFLLCAVAAYTISQRMKLIALQNLEEIEDFYHIQNPIDIKIFVNRTYFILNKTSLNLHPRKYLNEFKAIEKGFYPTFVSYPKTIVEYQSQEIEHYDKELLKIRNCEESITEEKQKAVNKFQEVEMENEEDLRVVEMEKACLQTILNKKEKVKEERDKLEKLRTNLINEENQILRITKQKMVQRETTNYVENLQILSRNIEHINGTNNLKNELLGRYSQLLRMKLRCKEGKEFGDKALERQKQYKLIQKHQDELYKQIDKMNKSTTPEKDLAKLNVVTSLGVIEDMIKKVENELKNEMGFKNDGICGNRAELRVIKLEAETRAVQKEVSKLLKMLTINKRTDATD